MNNSLKKFLTWRSGGEQRALERWAQIRVEGKRRFVLRTSLTLGLTMPGLTDVLDHISDGAQHSISLRNVIYYLLAGIPVALIGWSNMEARYQKALRAARVLPCPVVTTIAH